MSEARMTYEDAANAPISFMDESELRQGDELQEVAVLDDASAEDIASTKQIQRLLSGVEILVLDHIIVAHDNTYSMIQHGDIDYRR